MYVPTENEIKFLLDAAKKSSERDFVMFKVMRELGLSTGEAINVSSNDLDFKSRVIEVRGLEKKTRKLRITERLSKILEKYVEEKKGTTPYLFESRMGGRMTPRQVQKLMKKYAEKASLREDLTPMVLRHAFAAEFLKKNGDVLKLKKWLGHKSFTSLAIYLDTFGDEIGEQTEVIE